MFSVINPISELLRFCSLIFHLKIFYRFELFEQTNRVVKKNVFYRKKIGRKNSENQKRVHKLLNKMPEIVQKIVN